MRWLLSCVPDRDDLRRPRRARRLEHLRGLARGRWREKPWWRERIRSALASYWVYQHLGNLPAEELAADPDYREVLAAEGDTWPLLVALADRADAETDGSKGVRFSFRWDLGTSRFVMIDSRNGRILDGGAHLMLGESRVRWIEEQVRDRSAGDVDHLVLGTSLPWLLPHAIGDLQSINQLAAARPGWRGRLGETIRQGGDLEHWQAFRSSFDRLTRMVTAAATGARRAGDASACSPATSTTATPPRSTCRAPATTRDGAGRRCRASTSSPARRCTTSSTGSSSPGSGWAGRARSRGRPRWWAGRAGVPPVEVSWHKLAGPLFGNTVATLELDGRHARGDVPAAAVGGVDDARSRGWCWPTARAPRRRAGAPRRARTDVTRAVIDRSSPSRVRAARGG